MLIEESWFAGVVFTDEVMCLMTCVCCCCFLEGGGVAEFYDVLMK